MQQKLKALIFQGGGALGAYELGVAKALYEQPDFTPDIIAGVSIGAFSAAVLAGSKDDPIQGLEKLWDMLMMSHNPLMPDIAELPMSLAYNKGMYFLNPNNFFAPFKNTHFYNTKPLYKTLNEVIDFDKLNSKTAPKTILTATNIGTGQLDVFTNYSSGQRLEVEHVVASGSIPPAFPMVQIGDNYYWDGALFSNTPLKPALKALVDMADDRKVTGCEIEVILVELFPRGGDIPQNMTDVFNRMFELSFEAKMAGDIKQIKRNNTLTSLLANLGQSAEVAKIVKDDSVYQYILNKYCTLTLTTVEKTNNDDEHGEAIGSADFREKIIKKRIEQGYVDAKQQIIDC